MKTIFLFTVALACCSLLHAQQKQVPTFLDYLKKNRGLNTPTPQIFVIPDLKVKQQGKDILQNMVESRQAKLLSILPNGNKLYSLPQDNMPCIVPDMSQFNMPVVKSGNHSDEKINGSDQGKLIP